MILALVPAGFDDTLLQVSCFTLLIHDVGKSWGICLGELQEWVRHGGFLAGRAISERLISQNTRLLFVLLEPHPPDL